MNGWFAQDPDLDPTEESRRFLTALREHAAGWPCDPEDTYASFEVFEHRTELLVTLYLYDGEHHLLTVGAFLTGAGTRLSGGEFHDQLYTLEQHPETLIEARGTPEHLAERAAEWFLRMAALPVLRNEFAVGGRVVNRQWVLAGSGRELTARFRVQPGDPLARTVRVRGGSA
ncbi:hypothetical protein ABZO31_14520 [Streptomyces sp. HUAS MG47]|uniref:hypothetical protein n=1 Tax=Streptomyces solicamelliae TaxID=3231716 RepID=UPI003877E0A7